VTKDHIWQYTSWHVENNLHSFWPIVSAGIYMGCADTFIIVLHGHTVWNLLSLKVVDVLHSHISV